MKISNPKLQKLKIIGIGGTNASGKDTLANYLVEKYGYLFVSTGDMVREESMKREGNILRPSLVKVANELRIEQGPGVLVDLCIKKFKESSNKVGLIAASIRTKAEIEEIHKQGGILVYVDADPKIRYDRIVERQRSDDLISYNEFLKQQQAEWHISDDPGVQSIKTVQQMADHTLINNIDLNSFFTAALKALNSNSN